MTTMKMYHMKSGHKNFKAQINNRKKRNQPKTKHTDAKNKKAYK